jgi:ATP-dependent RNA helicase DeaD
VATDIAARGIDISDLGHVINYSLPEDPAVYLHRVGRTGRIGKKGTAINLVSGRELTTFSVLEKKYGISFEKRQMPTPEEALALWTEHHVREIRDGAAGAVYEGYLALAGQLKGRPDADDLIAFLLKYFFTHHRMERAQGQTEHRESPSSRQPTERAARERGGREREGRERDRDRAKGRERTRERPPPSRERKPEEAALPSGQARVWINVGKMDGASQDTLRGGLEELGAPGGKLVRVELRGTYSYLVVADPDVAAFESLSGKALQGKSLKIERAKRR